MSDVMDIIERDRKELKLSAEQLAVSVGLTSTTHSRLKKGRQKFGLDAIQAYATFARRYERVELLQVLGAYALGLEPDNIQIELKRD